MDTKEFEKQANEHKDALYRQMLRVCNQQEDAEDALATAMMLAFESASKLKSADAFRGWVGTIGKRVCYRMREHPGVQRALSFAEEHDLIPSEVDEMEVHVLKGCILDAFEQLPEIYRETYRLCELEEHTIPETAARLNISDAAVKSRLLRARSLMRELLDHSVCGRN